MKKVIRINQVVFVAMVLIFAPECKKEEQQPRLVFPRVSTMLNGIAATSAKAGGNVISDGGFAVTARGICFDTIDNPSINSQHVISAGSGTGLFASAITGLTPMKTYHIRAYATNSEGTAYGADIAFTTLGEVPRILGRDITSITKTDIILTSAINPNHSATLITFEYGLTTSYGLTATTSLGEFRGDTIANISVTITGLKAGTTYHLRVKAENDWGTTYSDDIIFTTLQGVHIPFIATESATNISWSGATLNAQVNANGLSTTIIFEYGTTADYSNSVTPSQSPATGDSLTHVSADISGLMSIMTYHFRVKAENSDGPVCGNDITFITDTCSQFPVATTLPATNISATGAKLNGTVNAHGLPTTVTFTCTSYRQGIKTVTAIQSPVAGDKEIPVSANISGFASGTTHTFSVHATNSCGTANASSLVFKTSK